MNTFFIGAAIGGIIAMVVVPCLFMFFAALDGRQETASEREHRLYLESIGRIEKKR
jgi:ABC-type glycerol-3-phosphate transport system permease component